MTRPVSPPVPGLKKCAVHPLLSHSFPPSLVAHAWEAGTGGLPQPGYADPVSKQTNNPGWVWWFISLITASGRQEAEDLGVQSQLGVQSEFGDSQGNTVRPYRKQTKQNTTTDHR